MPEAWYQTCFRHAFYANYGLLAFLLDPADIRPHLSLEHPPQIIRILGLVIFEHHLSGIGPSQNLNLAVRIRQNIAEAFPIAILHGLRLLYDIIASL